MGTNVGRVDAVRHPAPAAVGVRQHRRLRADVLPADRRAAVLLLVHRRVHREAYRSLPPDEQARFDPMITGFNPTDMYAADHIRRVLHDVPRRVLGHRRVHDSQGVRVGEGRRRDGEPARIRRSIACSTSRPRSGWSCIMHNDIDVPFPKPDAEPYLAQLNAICSCAIRRRRSSGRTSASDASFSGASVGGGGRAGPGRSASSIARVRSRVQPRELRHLLGRNREIHRRVARDDRGDRDDAQPASRSIPVRHRQGRPAGSGRRTSRSSRCTRRCSRS